MSALESSRTPRAGGSGPSQGKLVGKIAIITGAGAGIGEASAVLFAREGARVVVVDRDEPRAHAVTQHILGDGGQCIAVGADVTRSDDVHRIIAQTLQAFGKPNILFNNAGVNQENRRPLTHIPDEDFDRTIEVNLKGPFLMMKHVAPHMIEAGGGSIINTASISAFTVVSTAGYSASKAGLVAMTRVAAAELGRYNIRVNALCPGATMTPLAESQRSSMQARGLAVAEELMQRVTVFKRMAAPIEMAKMALFLASDDSSYATGAPFIVDGGWSSYGGIETRP
jgi:NAD(P)-dependent dehydrogenase (short-subunit alcohol dehydrogenase family)